MSVSHGKRFVFLTAAILPAVWGALAAVGQPASEGPAPAAPKPVSILAGRPDAEPDVSSTLLGAPFESKTAGIRFRPPAGTKQVIKTGSESIVDYVNDEESCLLRVSRYVPPTPVKLTDGVDQNGEPKGGLLDFTATKQKQTNTSGKILRKDVINVDSNYVGMIAMRFTAGTQRWLRQHAIVQVNEQLYFIFTLTTPAGEVAADVKPDDAAAVEKADPSEKTAVETFNAMVDSIKILDRTAIKEDQNQRLFRTRALMVYWNEKKLTAGLVPKEYFRLVKNGKDAGYTFVEEMGDTAEIGGVGSKGIAAYVRAHTEDRDEQDRRKVIDVGSYRYMSYDHKHENWTRATIVQSQTATGVTETHNSEFGSSTWETRKLWVEKIGVREKNDPNAPPMRPFDYHALDVNIWGKDSDEPPVHIDLPPFYLPQAGGHFLPRLVVDKAFPEARTYLFASYVPETHVLMMRYVDVSEEKDLSFNGQSFRGHTVTERLGLDGAPTVHYVTIEGKYLGSENKEARTVVIPSDEETIRRLWNNPNLSRPEKLEAPKGASRGAVVK